MINFGQNPLPLSPVQSHEKTRVIIMYICCLFVSITAIAGPIIGLVIALVSRNQVSSELAGSHISKQLRVFMFTAIWMVGSIAYFFLAVTLTYWLDTGLGIDTEDFEDYVLLSAAAILLGALLWYFYRSLVGFILILRNEPIKGSAKR
ncbi:hypothetical protein BGP77_07330 [Saccharospirillum sp. MSK14-1]|uniref:hypothetical protein n=1 Tax=Saccharospirillum sp. MSK14-1 TaxID=1897632 RepID=UPI000D370269|nr:hypothetical protein [Saccharospirillum sp. MSK14-1]PTY37084.1 hypothetical protein BGP77_07330 [Saccharospirillum sp. MSK14-1]